MLPEALLNCEVNGRELVPRFLGDADRPWLGELVRLFETHEGRRWCELEMRMTEPLTIAASPAKQKLAAHVLGRLWATTPVREQQARKIRDALFVAAAALADRDAACVAAATTLGMAATQVAERMFDDLPGQTRVARPQRLVDAGELALRANLALAQGLVARSRRVRLWVHGGSRAIVRLAKLRGLICCVERFAGEGESVMELSGPFAMFRRTLVYARALAELVPRLSWCNRFRLVADCHVRGRELTLRLGSGDPIFPSVPPREFDSALERRFAEDFARAAPGWELIREPEPIGTSEGLMFPDFSIAPREAPRDRWLVEVVGYWTPEYVARKVRQLREVNGPRFIICVDDSLCCSDGDLAGLANVVRFRKRVPVAQVLALVAGPSAFARASGSPQR